MKRIFYCLTTVIIALFVVGVLNVVSAQTPTPFPDGGTQTPTPLPTATTPTPAPGGATAGTPIPPGGSTLTPGAPTGTTPGLRARPTAGAPTTGASSGPIAGKQSCKGDTGIRTALGCIPVSTTNDFISWFLRWSIGIAGGTAFLMIVFSSFQIMTAGGDPQKLQGGRELLTAAISGLILIIFSVFLLKLIGVTILNIPGL